MATVRNKDGIEFDIDAIATDINGKVDKDLTNCTRPYIIETYVNGDSGYIVYSNGYCEQWGKYTKNVGGVNAATINLVKTYTNTDYSILATAITNGSTTVNCYDLQVNLNNKTTSSFSIGMGADSTYWRGAYWRTVGYIS